MRTRRLSTVAQTARYAADNSVPIRLCGPPDGPSPGGKRTGTAQVGQAPRGDDTGQKASPAVSMRLWRGTARRVPPGCRTTAWGARRSVLQT